MDILPYELTVCIISTAVYPHSRLRVMKKIYPIRLTCKYFNWICCHKLFISKIVPQQIMGEYMHLDVPDFISQYFKPITIICNDPSASRDFVIPIYKIDSFIEFKHRISGRLNVL
jgi:hypothetical protein